MRSWARRATELAAAASAIALASCGGAAGDSPRSSSALTPRPVPSLMAPVEFSFDSLDERPVSSTATAGKPTVIAFVTTWDLVCQAQTDFLVAMAAHDAATTNYVLVAMQPRAERALVETYARTLKVSFPVALAEPTELGAESAFGAVDQVPTVVVLDRRGRLRWRHVGLARSEDVRAHMRGL